jgi:hypothetical protein
LYIDKELVGFWWLFCLLNNFPIAFKLALENYAHRPPRKTDAMSTPPTIIYVRPGLASYTWSYAGTSMPSGAGTAAVTAVAFDASSSLGQAASRGDLQYSVDNGKTWIAYALPVDGQGAYVSVTGTLWRFQDRASGNSTPDSFNAHYRLADGSVATVENTVVADSQPVGLTGSYDILFSTMQAGDLVDLLSGVDTGALTGGRWMIDSQSTPGLFAIAYNPALDTAGKLVIANPALLPASGLAAAVTIHYYDRYQVDGNGNPIANTGVTRTLTYTVEDGTTRDLAGFTDEARLGAATGAANPALATLSGGGLVAVWQGADTLSSPTLGGAGAGLWAQLRDAGGNALGSIFALTPNGDARVEGQPALGSLAGGRFVVAYTLREGGANKIAYRVVEANGTAGAEHVIDAGTSGDASMPTVATLADGSFVVGWRSGGTVHVQQAAADGSLAGAQQVYGALGSAYSPGIEALKQGGYVVSWGEINDGNVYASINGGATFVVSGDGYAASVTTAAPLPHVTALAGGGFVVAWDSYVNDPHGFSISDIYFQVYDGAGHALGAVTQANVESGGGRYDAALAALSDGGFVITWEGGDGDGNGVFGRRFGFDGSALDPHEFAVSQLRAGDQSTPDVVALANGGFATAWVDTAANGSVSVEVRVLEGLAAPSSTLQGGWQTVNAGSAVTAAAAGTPAAAPTNVLGGSGDNALAVPSGASVLDGGAGLDTVVYGASRAAYTVYKDGTGFAVDGSDGSHASLANVERIEFADKQMVALDIAGVGGEAFRIYQAAFGRAPDAVGLGYWIATMDSGETLSKVAANFVSSDEFAYRYGAGSSDAEFVQALYHNVLHRDAEGDGFTFWMQSLAVDTRGQVLLHFSESLENQTQVIGSIENGIDYTQWG